MVARDMFSDNKGHRIASPSSERYQMRTKKRYHEDPEIKATADFIRTMDPRFRKKGFRFDPAWLVYIIILFVMGYLMLLQFSIPEKTVTVTRTTTQVPLIQTGAELTAGRLSANGDVPLERWWNGSLGTPCTGAEKFYTGLGFFEDWNRMIAQYNTVYYDPGEEPIEMQMPAAMLGNATNYDCEDMAHATRCLAVMYNVTCSFWEKKNIGEVVPEDGGHLGVCCDITGSWRCI
jgi:hypothetical protein